MIDAHIELSVPSVDLVIPPLFNHHNWVQIVLPVCNKALKRCFRVSLTAVSSRYHRIGCPVTLFNDPEQAEEIFVERESALTKSAMF